MYLHSLSYRNFSQKHYFCCLSLFTLPSLDPIFSNLRSDFFATTTASAEISLQANIFFFGFVFVGVVVVLNLFIAVILDQFGDAETGTPLCRANLDKLRDEWAKLDPEARPQSYLLGTGGVEA